jgi:hypothetical protein
MKMEDANALNRGVKPQNWTTFETEHQRKTGKSVADTMGEIDALVAGGKTKDGRAVEHKSEVPPSKQVGCSFLYYMSLYFPYIAARAIWYNPYSPNE